MCQKDLCSKKKKENGRIRFGFIAGENAARMAE